MIDFGIIAAGDGNRIKEEGSPLPKPLVDINGEPMIGRLINIMEASGANSVSVIVNSDMPDVAQYLDSLRGNLLCELKVKLMKTQSSMHTLYELLKIMNPKDRFIVTTVDTIFNASDFLEYIECFKKSPESLDGLMGVTDYIDDEKPLYVATNEEMKVIAYRDTDSEDTKYVSAGIYGLGNSALPVLSDCVNRGVKRMRNFQRSLLDSGLSLKAYNLGKVIDVDHLSDIETANKFLKKEE